jgi:hypothetical protein
MRRIRSIITDPELLFASVFGLLVTTHVFLMVDLMQHRPDAPAPPPQQQPAPPRIEATPHTSF